MKFSWKFWKRRHPFDGVNVTLKDDTSLRGFAISPKDGWAVVYWKNYHRNRANSQEITREKIEDLQIIRPKGEYPQR